MSVVELRSRLGSANGWVRLDGRPLARSSSELFDDFIVYYPVEAASSPLAVGTAESTCQGWTSTQGMAALGIYLECREGPSLSEATSARRRAALLRRALTVAFELTWDQKQN